MLRFANYLDIQECLSYSTQLVSLYYKADANFPEEVKKWLVRVEETLLNNNMPEVPLIASFRGTLISAEIGNIPVDLKLHKQETSRRVRSVAAFTAISKTCELFTPTLQREYLRFQETEKIIAQIIARAKAKNLFYDGFFEDVNPESIKLMWKTFSNDPELKPGIISAESLAGSYDVLIIFDRIINNFK